MLLPKLLKGLEIFKKERDLEDLGTWEGLKAWELGTFGELEDL